MKLASYLSPSRHGVYYFRWPLPVVDKCKRQTVKVSLRTKCPDRAGELARYMAACGILIRDNKSLRKLRQDEIRNMVRDYFVKALEGYTERLNDTGWDERELGRLREELSIHEDGIAAFDDLSDQYLDIQTASPSCSADMIKLLRRYEYPNQYAAPERLPFPSRDHRLLCLGLPPLRNEHV